MNLEKMPLVLQYGITGFLLINSFGITYSLIRGSDLNVEAVNTKLTLTGKINKTKQLTTELKQASRELTTTPTSPQASRKIKAIQQELESTQSELEELENEVVEPISKKDKNNDESRIQDDNLDENTELP